MRDYVTYEELLTVVGQGQKTMDELITYALQMPAQPGQHYGADAAFKVVLADVLIAIGISQLSVVSFLGYLGDALTMTLHSLEERALELEHTKGQIPMPWTILQILEGRWVLYPGKRVFDLEFRRVAQEPVTPSLSTALNVTVLWLRTMPRLMGLDFVVERVAAALSTPGYGSSRTL